MSDATVFARALESWLEPTDSVPVTVTRFQVERVLAGVLPGSEFQVHEIGGHWDGLTTVIAGSPSYVTGSRYLLFLSRGPGLRWRSRMMAYGLLVEDEAQGLLRPLPEAVEFSIVASAGVEAPATYRRDALLDHLAAVARGSSWDARSAQQISAAWDELHLAPSACKFLLDNPPPPNPPGDNLPFRYFGFALTESLSIIPTTPAQPGFDSAAAVAAAVTAWTADPASVINYFPVSAQPTTADCADSSAIVLGEAIFDDPCSEIPNLSGCVGTLAFGGSAYTGETTAFHGEQWHRGFMPFAVVNNGLDGCINDTAFREMLTHELGHSLGFDHHTDSDATMFGTLHNDGRGASLRTTDSGCASYAYHTWDPVRRRELASLLLRAAHAPYTPPACNPAAYGDVVCGSTPFAAFITDLDTLNISQGCNAGGTLFCPDDVVTREQAAMLLLKAMGITPDPCVDPTGYGDVACGDPFGPWIKELREQNLTSGCDDFNTLYCPKDPLTRSALATYFARAALPIPPGD